MVSILILLLLFLVLLCFVCIWIYLQLVQKKNHPQRLQSIQRQLTEEKTKVIEEKQEIKRRIVEVRPPEIERLDKLFKDFEEQPQENWDILIAIGDVYKAGAYPRFLPNENIALECYKIAAMCPDGEIAGTAQSKYMDLRMNPIDAVDKAGSNLPAFYGEQACRVAITVIQNMSHSMFEKPKYTKRNTNQVSTKNIPVNIYNFDDTGNAANEEIYNILETIQRSRNNIVDTSPIAETPQYYSDSQNVHDHGVVKSIKKNIDMLSTSANISTKDNSDIKEQVRNSILNSDISEEDKYNALQVVDSLNDKYKHSSFDVSESDALGLIWSKIQSIKGKDKENLEEMLARQLASGVEHGNVVCSTGKITRIMGTFDGVVAPESASDIGIQQVKPMYAVKEEIASLAAKVRDKYDGRMSASEMQQEFKKEVYKEYVDKLGMNASVVDPIIGIYEEGF